MTMGLIHADFELADARKDDVSPVVVSAFVDGGSLHPCIPQTVATQLELPVLRRREVALADDRVPTLIALSMAMGFRTSHA